MRQQPYAIKAISRTISRGKISLLVYVHGERGTKRIYIPALSGKKIRNYKKLFDTASDRIERSQIYKCSKHGEFTKT